MISEPFVYDFNEVVLIHLFVYDKDNTKVVFRSDAVLIQERSRLCPEVIISVDMLSAAHLLGTLLGLINNMWRNNYSYIRFICSLRFI